MKGSRSPRLLLLVAGATVALGTAGIVVGVTFTATPKLVTNTTGGRNENPSLDQQGELVVFTSNVNHVSGVDNGSPAGAFDFDSMGNDFTPPGATHPNPICLNCSPVDSADGQLFLWRRSTNTVAQLTFPAGGGFAANQFPDINQNGTVIAWDSDRDHTPAAPGNADGNREIFLIDLGSAAITQVTNTSGGGETANRNVNWSDAGDLLVFDSTRDFSSVAGCTLGDGTSPCDNADGNSEIMLYDRANNTFAQITNTTGGDATANIRPRISNEGRFVAFQSTRDFSGALPGGASCALAGGGACSNEGNGEIMRYDRATNSFLQVTSTTCDSVTANERVEISKGGRFITWQLACESQLNSGGCGSCGGNDEAFLFDGTQITQLTISAAGFNRVPRVAGSGRYIIFESNRNYNNLNPGHLRILYILRRRAGSGPAGTPGAGQLVEDGGLVKNAKAKVLTINFAGGFNSTVEQFGASSRGRFYAFDNKKGVRNQEVWFLDRTR
jgi:Tol biopolymer transport system component